MVNQRKKDFGKRLSAILEASGVTKEELAVFLGRTEKQVGNYLDGKQFPTGSGMIKLHILFGMYLGEVIGTQEWITPADRTAIRDRMKKLT